MALGVDLVRRIQRRLWLPRSKAIRVFLRDLYLFLYRILTVNRGLKVDIGGMGVFRLDYAFAFNRFESWGSGHNDGFCRLIEECNGKTTVFDIGAHIGLCALPVSRSLRENGTVFAFEPSEINLHYLRKHIRYNRIANILTFPYLVGEACQTGVSFYEAREVTGMNSIVQHKVLETAVWTQREQICLDDFCEKHRVVPDVIKIDVEGAEGAVLRGARNILARHHPTVILSAHPKHLELLAESETKFIGMIGELGYSIYDMSGNRTDQLALKEYILKPKERVS